MENKENTSPGSFFYMMPDHVLSNKNLTDSEKILYSVLLGLSQSTGYVFASDAWLCQKLGKELRHMQSMIKKLEDEGYIRRQTDSGKTSLQICIN